MARKRKSRCKNKTSFIKDADAGGTSMTHNWGKKAGSRKRKAVSQTEIFRHRKRSKMYKKVKSSSSIELVRVEHCCPSDQEREKYAKLGLDSALFFSNSKPAKRKQSHISVITISSSDDEDLNNEKTAEWIAKMDMETINISSTEEPFPSGDADFSLNNSTSEEILEAEICRPQKSYTQICSTPESTFKPLCASTPHEELNTTKFLCLSTPKAEENHLTIYKGPSFLENPVNDLRQHLTTLCLTEKSPPKQTQVDDEYRVRSALPSRFSSPRFYFGPSQNSQTLQQKIKSRESSDPMLSDLSNFSTIQISNKTDAQLLNEESQRQETEARRYSLVQIPSTSQDPVSVPVLEVTPTRKKSKNIQKSPTK